MEGDFVPGEAIVCLRAEEQGAEDAISRLGAQAAVWSETLMDVSGAALALGEEGKDGLPALGAAEGPSKTVLTLVHSDVLTTEELLSY